MQRDAGLMPAGIDAADGYGHFSKCRAIEATLDAYYHGHDDLIILAVDAAARWRGLALGAIARRGAVSDIFMGRLRKIWWVRGLC